VAGWKQWPRPYAPTVTPVIGLQVMRLSAVQMSIVMASDYRVRDFETWLHATERGRVFLRQLGAHHLVVYRSIHEPERVFVTLGIRSPAPVHEVVRSRVLLDWYGTSGLDEIPPVFVGRIVEKIRSGADDQELDRTIPGASVVVARIMPVKDLTNFLAAVHASWPHRVARGCRQYWTYQAVDDPAEVMTLEEIDSLDHAEQWLRNPEAKRVFYDRAGVGIYPDTFVGRLVETVDVESPAEV
jgi:hypothetical protein